MLLRRVTLRPGVTQGAGFGLQNTFAEPVPHGRRHRGGRGGQVPRYRKLAGYSTPLSSVRLEARSVVVYT